MQLSRRRLLYLAAAAALVAPRIAGAQAYPARPVRVIVPFAPAGPTDVFARLMAQKLYEQMGAQFYVENIAGAGGNIGAARAAHSPPDGYTILVNGGNHVVNPALYPHVAFDPIKDFDPVTIAVSAPAVLTVHPSLPAQTVQDLVTLLKASPGKYSFASPGTGTPPGSNSSARSPAPLRNPTRGSAWQRWATSRSPARPRTPRRASEWKWRNGGRSSATPGSRRNSQADPRPAQSAKAGQTKSGGQQLILNTAL